MSILNGMSLALANSFVNASCDPLRKYITNYLNPFEAVAIRGLIQVPLFWILAYFSTGTLPHVNRMYYMAIFVSGSINIVTSYLYNRSLQLAPLSSTVPYLSFSPIFLLLISFFVLGEIPTSLGVIGVIITSLGGFYLHQSDVSSTNGIETLTTQTLKRGSLYMIAVAALWSISSAFDKLGVQNSTPLFYGASIHTIVAAGSFLAQQIHFPLRASKDPILGINPTLKQPTPYFSIFFAALASIISFWLYLLATKELHVTYVIAIKRSGCLWTIIFGKVFFKESKFLEKLPSVLMMVIGVGCVVLGG